MTFTKMHGLGNDYLYYYGELPDAAALSIRWSNRHFGVGSDGIITISESNIADFRMRIYNADGSEAKMCGNGIRCVGKYVYEHGYTKNTEIDVETLSGIKHLSLTVSDGKVIQVAVDMGTALVSAPMTLSAAGQSVTCLPVSMGNPHAVVFTEDAEKAPLTTLGAAMEKHSAFPGGVNVEFVSLIGPNHLRMRVWERGSGITMACGTGACASVAAAIQSGRCSAGIPVIVDLDGGALQITINENMQVKMVGPAETVCDCQIAV